MPLPGPAPGLVLAYSYLWKRQHAAGGEEGEKDRPCVIVLASTSSDGETVVTVVPVTSRPPGANRAAIEIPPKVMRHLRLGTAPSWIIVDEVNRFVWPGPDLRQIPGHPGRFDYGFIPPKLYAAIKAALLAVHASRRLTGVDRTP